MFKRCVPFLLILFGFFILMSSASARVLWHQPVSTENTFAYYNQEYSPGELHENDVYIADDFVADIAWVITNIFVPGDYRYPKLGYLSTLLDATTLNWEIYEDVNGKPAGNPRDLVNVAVWRLSLPPDDPQVLLTKGTKGYPTNVTLDLNSWIYLNPGTYWLIFYPELDWETYGGFGRQPSDTDYNNAAKAVKPVDTYTTFPTTWTSVTAIPWSLQHRAPDLSHQDFAFTLWGGLVQDIGVEPTTYSFGSVMVGQTKILAVTITSKGTGDLTISDIAISGASTKFTVDVTGGAKPCNSTSKTLAAGDFCTVEVTFSPTNLVNQTGFLDITSDDPDTAITQVPLSGIGVGDPASDIAVNPNAHDFGDLVIGGSASQVFTITNNGNTALVITDIGFSGDSAAMFSVEVGGGNPCGSLTPTIPDGNSCTVNVTYTPTTGGAHSAYLDIDSNDPDFATFQVNLSGIGLYDIVVSTLQGTVGTEITFSESPTGFGIKKGKILLLQNGVTKATLKILKGGWLNDTVTGTVNKALPEGVYDVKIMLQPYKTAAPIVLPGAFTFKKPEITSLNRNSGAPSTEFGINGNFFGSKRPKVYLEYKDTKGVDRKKNCRVMAYQMDKKTGESTIGLLVPKGLPAAEYPLRVETKKVGISVEDVNFTIITP